jgi:glycosyltransferase involved in cell wall biosynthesis
MQHPTPWLSILMPAFNVEHYLEECVQSIVDQGIEGVELCVLDDASTDSTRAIAFSLAQRYAGQVRVFEHESNQGLSAARNSLLQRATGNYVWFLDSDDKLLPGSIASLKAIVDRCEPDVVLCDFAKWFETPRAHQWLRRDQHQSTFKGPSRTLVHNVSLMLRGVFAAHQMHTWSKIAKRRVWEMATPFPVGRYFEDISTTPLLLLQAHSLWYEPSPWVAYRQREGSILKTPNVEKLDHLAHAMRLATVKADVSKLDAKAKFAWSYFATRCYIGACKQVVELPKGQLRLPAYRDALLASLATAPDQLTIDHLLRGWILRWLRLRRWLRRSRAVASAS